MVDNLLFYLFLMAIEKTKDYFLFIYIFLSTDSLLRVKTSNNLNQFLHNEIISKSYNMFDNSKKRCTIPLRGRYAFPLRSKNFMEAFASSLGFLRNLKD